VHLQSAVDATRDFIGYAHCQFSGRSTRDAGFPINLLLLLIEYIIFILGRLEDLTYLKIKAKL